jgi:hypothetical protein
MCRSRWVGGDVASNPERANMMPTFAGGFNALDDRRGDRQSWIGDRRRGGFGSALRADVVFMVRQARSAEGMRHSFRGRGFLTVAQVLALKPKDGKPATRPWTRAHQYLSSNGRAALLQVAGMLAPCDARGTGAGRTVHDSAARRGTTQASGCSPGAGRLERLREMDRLSMRIRRNLMSSGKAARDNKLALVRQAGNNAVSPIFAESSGC